MGKNQEVAKAAGIIGGATLISRLLGYVRDMIIGSFFGAGTVTDAFFAAYRIPNYLRRIVGEGTLNASFVPVFTETLKQEGRKKAQELASIVITFISLVLTLFTLLGMIFSPFVVQCIAPGFSDDPSQFELTVMLTRVIFPFAIFVGLSAALMGVLNSLKHFAAPALAPALLNIAMILSALFLSKHLSVPVLSLAIGVLVGGILQFLIQIPVLLRKRFGFSFRLDLRNEGMRRIFRLMVPGIIGQSVLQVNILVGNILASFLAAGSISYLFFADRLVQFPLALFGLSAATAMLPTLSAQASENHIPEMIETLSKTMRMVLYLMIPSMVGLMILREPIVSTLFQRGSFDYHATQGTALALMYYAIGLWAFAEVKVVVQVFYAMQDTWTPMKVAVLALAANLLLSLLLMFPLKHGGLALANSLASMINLFILTWILRRRVGRLQGRKLLISAVKIMSASLVMGIFVYSSTQTPLWLASGQTISKFVVLGKGILYGLISFLVMSLLLRVEEFQTMRQWLFQGKST